MDRINIFIIDFAFTTAISDHLSFPTTSPFILLFSPYVILTLSASPTICVFVNTKSIAYSFVDDT